MEQEEGQLLPQQEGGDLGAAAGVNPYELQRLQIIARNRARLLALGLPEAVSGLAALKTQPRRKKRKRKESADEPEAPSRASDRLRDRELVAPGKVPPGVEQGSELAVFIIDGECPKCGKVLSVGHARHLEACKGPPEPPTEERIAAQAEVYSQQTESKVHELELGGLVEYVPTAAADADADAAAAGDGGGSGAQAGHATFVVVGSMGSHYVVKLNDVKRSCTCMDHRIRKRNCKHIQLLLNMLGITAVKASYAGWEQALCEHLDALGAADDADIEAVQEAEARAAARKAKAAGKASKPEAAAAAAAAAGGGGEEAGEEGGGEQDDDEGGGGAAAAAATGGKGKGGGVSKKRKKAGGKSGGAKKKAK